jgi:predicted ATPase/DNA-binding SARP family transcriptional activator/Tfp pilus assembly protein PilF
MDEGFQLRLLGPFELVQNGRLLSRFESDKARALLAYLALEPGPHAREALCDLLWPEADLTAGRHNLSQTMFSLRQLLGGAGPFLVDRASVGLDPAYPLRVDAREFDELLGACRRHAHPRVELCVECAGRQQQAVALYRGNLLAGLSVGGSAAFDNWLTVEQERLHRQAIDALEALARYHEWRGEVALARDYAQRQVGLEPWREEAHRQLMRLLAHSGQRSAALMQFQHCREALQEELGIEPARATVELAERIRQAEAIRRHNLPGQMTPFVGRARELAALSGLLAHPDCRLLALVGRGGVGKTRLALELAERLEARFLDGVWFVPLADVDAAEALPLAIAAALDLVICNQAAPLAELVSYLRQKEALLVLDNMDSVRGGAGPVAEIARAAPQVKLLVTSRERPNLAAAWAYDVGGLDVPSGEAAEAAETVEASGAGQLFVSSARRARYDFALGPGDAAAISRMCALVDGLPLALELMAPWTRSLPCAAVLAAVEQSLDFLATSSPDVAERHRSMRAVVDSSWELLRADEQAAFSRLAVFHAGFTWQAAQEVAGATAPALSALINKSLVHAEADGRYALHELLRQYAHDRLAGEGAALEETHERHARHYAARLREHEQALAGGDPDPALRLLEADWGNVRAAWQWSVAQARVDLLQATSNGVFWWCQWSNRYHEGQALFELAVKQLVTAEEPAEAWLAGLLARYGRLCTQAAEYEAAETLLARSVPALRAAGSSEELAQALDFWGDVERQRGRHSVARGLLEDSVAGYRRLDAPAGLARALWSLGAVVDRLGEYALARRYAEESLELYRQIGNRRGIATALHGLGHTAYELGELVLSEQYYTESLQLRRELGDRWGLAQTYNNLGIIYHDVGKYDEAETYFQEALALHQELGDKRGTAVALNNVGLIADIRQDYHRAEQLYRQALDLSRQIGDQQSVCIGLNNLGEVATAERRYDTAYSYHQQSLALSREIGYRRGVSYSLEYLGMVALKLARLDEARQYFGEALQIAWEAQALARVLQSLHGLAQFHKQSGDARQAALLGRIVAAHPATAEQTRTEALALLGDLGSAAEHPAGGEPAGGEAAGAAALESAVRGLLPGAVADAG